MTGEADHCRLSSVEFLWSQPDCLISKDTAQLCSLVRSFSPGDPRDQGSSRTLGPGGMECGLREAPNLSHVWEPSEKSLTLGMVTPC